MRNAAAATVFIGLISVAASAGSCEGIAYVQHTELGQTQLINARTQNPFTVMYDPNSTRLWCGALQPGGEPSVVVIDLWDEDSSLTVFARHGGAFKIVGTVEITEDKFRIVKGRSRIGIVVKQQISDTERIHTCTYHVAPDNTLRKDGCRGG